MQLNYNHLFYFHVAATEGTVTAAAQKLGVTTGTASEQLRALERAVVLIDRTPLVAVAPPNVNPEPDWRDVAIVQYRPSTAYRKEVDTFLHAAGLKPRIAAEVDDALLLVEAVVEGGFVGVVPHAVARAALAAGRIRVLAYVEPPLAVHALYHDSASAELVRRAVKGLAANAETQVEPGRES